MICGWHYKTALILSIPSMQKTRSFSINTGPNANIRMPLVSAHLVPDTDNRFILECHESKFIFLRTIETGARQVLIHGSPNCPKGIRCALFLKNEQGYELHFCTKQRTKGSTIVSWYRWNLNKDFFKDLKTYGKIPLDMDYKK